MRSSFAVFSHLTLALGCCASSAVAQSSAKPNMDKVPGIVLAGMNAYKSNGPDEAVRAWLRGSPLDGSKEAMSQAGSLRTTQEFYGAFQDFDILSTYEISSRIRTIYVTLNFERGPVFGRFNVYHLAQGWIVDRLEFNTREEAILPASPTPPENPPPA